MSILHKILLEDNYVNRSKAINDRLEEVKALAQTLNKWQYDTLGLGHHHRRNYLNNKGKTLFYEWLNKKTPTRAFNNDFWPI